MMSLIRNPSSRWIARPMMGRAVVYLEGASPPVFPLTKGGCSKSAWTIKGTTRTRKI